MSTLLVIDSSPMQSSVSRELTQEFSRSWKASHPHGEVIHRDLAAQAPQPVDAAWIQASYTPDPQREAVQHLALAQSEQFLAELERADEYVIGVSMHNFSIPSVLKLWIDQVVRAGRTFVYAETGPQGLLQGKKATVLVASGGVYAPGTPMAAMDFIEPYLRTILGFIGVTDVNFVWAGGTARLASGTVSREELLEPALDQVHAIAA